MKILSLNSLSYAKGSIKKKCRVGRGNSARKGNKCGKGSNGNQQRSGFKRKWGFEGGQIPINKRIPMQHHINNYRKNRVFTVTIDALSALFNSGRKEISKEILIENKIIKGDVLYKIVKGKVNTIIAGVSIYANSFSEGAKILIEQTGSKCVLLQKN